MAYYKDNYGIEIPESMQMGYAEEETNFAPIIAKIKSSGADGMIHIGNQQPAILISKAIARCGSHHSDGCERGHRIHRRHQQRGQDRRRLVQHLRLVAHDDTPRSARRSRRLTMSATAMDTEMLNAVTYDSVYLIKADCDLAGTTLDREVINAASPADRRPRGCAWNL